MKATVVVWSRLKMRRCFHLMPMSERLWSWKIGFAGPTNRKLLTIPSCDVSARTLWIPDQHVLATFGFRTTLAQRRSTAEEDHGWYVAEVSRKHLKLDDPFGPIPDLESYAQGEDVIVLTIVSGLWRTLVICWMLVALHLRSPMNLNLLIVVNRTMICLWKVWRSDQSSFG